VEKPTRATRRAHARRGRAPVNSGKLVARAQTVLEELETAGAAAATRDSASSAEIAASRARSRHSSRRLEQQQAYEAFGALPRRPLRQGGARGHPQVAVVPADLDWSDVGSLVAPNRWRPPMSGATSSPATRSTSSRPTASCTRGPARGHHRPRGPLVVDTADATLVAPKDRAQDVRLIVDALREREAPEITETRSSLRPWWSWTRLTRARASR
jgi:mannose-1-phosphate guanylyltransferase